MVSKVTDEDAVIIKFGGGLHTRASEEEINPREAADGENFTLDIENRQLRNRKPFDKIGTAPNGSEIRGGASLLKADGTVSFLIQAGDTVYEWDGLSTFTAKATVDSTAKLRGRWPDHQWTLDDKVLITDLQLVEQVKEWDGTTFQDVDFKDENNASFGDFFAKYCQIASERATFSNTKDSSSATPHLIVGSKRGNYKQITVSDRPSSALSTSDPWFLVIPDLKPINGHVGAFGVNVFSTQKGRIFQLTGENAKDFAIEELFAGSHSSGVESVAYVGNDIVYGRAGKIESIRDTDRFGDVESNDLTLDVADQIASYDEWTTVFNSRINRAYFFPSGQSEVWVAQPFAFGGETSPWMRWTTQNSLSFQPTFVMNMLDPQDGLEYVFMGDSSGNLYRMEGFGANGDGGSSSIKLSYTSSLFSAPIDAHISGVQGWIKYRKGDAATVKLTMLYAGEAVFDESVTIDIPAISGRTVYGGGYYYNDGNYYGTAFEGRLVRQQVAIPGQSNEFQVRIEVDGKTDIEINEIGIMFREAS